MLRRALLVAVLGALAALVAVSPAHADGDFYLVSGFGDGGGQCTPYPNVAGGFSCPTLRAAVAAAEADPGFDDVIVPNGDYHLTQGQIAIAGDTIIAGQDARNTRIFGDGSNRVFDVAQGANAILYGITVTGGNAIGGQGGGIRNAGTLEMEFMRVTNSQAATGGAGVSSSGQLIVFSSLIDNNVAADGPGGGILVSPSGSLLLMNSTIFKNNATAAGGIDSQSTTQEAELIHATVADNGQTGSDPGGARFASTWISHGSLFARNQGDSPGPTNCEGTLDSSSSGNIEDGSRCGFATSNATIGLDTALTDQGGHTPVLTIPATSPAKRLDGACETGNDQRNAPRNVGAACDAGAFEQGATAPPLSEQFVFPTPTASPTPPPTPTPVVTPTPTPTPTPVPGKTVVVAPVKGKVLVKKPGTNQFVEVDGTQGIPLGSTIDTTHGTIQLTSQQTVNGKPQTAIFFDGLFKITQTKKTTDLTLNQPLATCRKKGRAAAAAAKKKPKTRKLWGSGHGSFRTKGQYSAATVRGTKWLVQDSCAGTLTRVTQGVVSVRDNVRHKTILLKAGKRYLARPRH